MTLSAVLLAGGESRRMGVDKATIIFRGVPLWERQLAILRDLQPEKIFVSTRVDPSWRPVETELLLDEPPSRGPLSGLTRALKGMKTSHLIALAVDMPFMTSEQMRCLCEKATPGCGVVPVIGERAEPLAAIYPREAAPDCAAALAGRDFSLQALVRKLAAANKVQIVSVPETDEHLYRSVNEPNDLPLGTR
ncbi:MAG: molybdenum cofactor guanylyltransferase [Verrucomicrobiota bacterium]|jgi:molybdopterin-guanine dinucleotide biosynthesis protein A